MLAREQSTLTRPHIRWVEFRSRGYLVVDISAQRARGEWWLLDAVDRRDAAERMAAAFEAARGANHLTKA